MSAKVVITGVGSISPLSSHRWSSYTAGKSSIVNKVFSGSEFPVAPLCEEGERELEKLIAENPHYGRLDRASLMAISATRNALQGLTYDRERVGVNIGSSRGATNLLERYYEHFLKSQKRVPVQTSPTTTLGVLSSAVMQDLDLHGPGFSHSSTCSTSLYAIANGIAWLRAEMCDLFVAGGTEAALTPFTLAQLSALRIYSRGLDAYPCRPCNTLERNTMVLGEGACVLTLERDPSKNKALAVVDGVGWGSEKIETSTSLSHDGESLRSSMVAALKARTNEIPIDLILLHAPGTVVGDRGELNAVKALFGDNVPLLFSNKWCIGHTMGAAGAFGIELAIDILKENKVPDFPYEVSFKNRPLDINSDINTIMVNSAGFGGQALSVIISRAGI